MGRRRRAPSRRGSTARRIKTLDLDQLAARALNHQAHDLVALFDNLDVRTGGARLNHTRDLQRGVVPVMGSKGLTLEGLSTYKKGFQLGNRPGAVGLEMGEPATGEDAGGAIFLSSPGLGAKDRLSVIRWFASASGFSPGSGRVSA